MREGSYRVENVQDKYINRIILFFSDSTVGIYMIHEYSLIRTRLWNRLDLAKRSAMYGVIASDAIFVICGCCLIHIEKNF